MKSGFYWIQISTHVKTICQYIEEDDALWFFADNKPHSLVEYSTYKFELIEEKTLKLTTGYYWVRQRNMALNLMHYDARYDRLRFFDDPSSYWPLEVYKDCEFTKIEPPK